MANKIITFGDSSQNFIDDQLSASLSSNTPPEVYLDISMQAEATGLENPKFSRWKVQKNVNVEAIFRSLNNIFTWIPGERIILPEFGSRLQSLLYEGITEQTEEKIVAEIRHCATKWEPRVSIVEVRNISTVEDTEDNTIHLEVIFTIPSLSDEHYAYRFSYDRPR